MRVFAKLNRDLAREKEKMKVAADNIARSSVFGAKTKVVVENSFGSMVAPMQTNSKHLRGTSSTSAFRTTTRAHGPEPSFNDNNIDPDKELKNAADAATNSHRDITVQKKVFTQLMSLLS